MKMKKLFIVVGGSEAERRGAASDLRKEANKRGLEASGICMWSQEISRMLGEFSDRLEEPTRKELLYLLLKAKAEADGPEWFAKKLISYLADCISIDFLTVVDVIDPEQIRIIREEAEKENILVFVVQTDSILYGQDVKPDFKLIPGFSIPVIINAVAKN